jgi:hypothetical protein
MGITEFYIYIVSFVVIGVSIGILVKYDIDIYKTIDKLEYENKNLKGNVRRLTTFRVIGRTKECGLAVIAHVLRKENKILEKKLLTTRTCVTPLIAKHILEKRIQCNVLSIIVGYISVDGKMC